MFKKTLIKCPRCEIEGRTKTIGLIFPNGIVSIQREFIPAKGDDEPKRDYTIIQGKDFSLICGYCGEVVYRKEVQNEGSSFGKSWVYWGTFVQNTFRAGTLGSQIR